MSAALASVTPMHPKAPAQTYLSPEGVCELVPGMTVRKLQRLRDAGQGPRYSKPTRKTVVYAEADVHAWVAAQMQSTKGGA